MEKKVRRLRVCYWLGAIFDGLVIIPMLFPNVAVEMFGVQSSQLGTEYRYAMAVGASLMAGWTVLLIWADRKPLERRGILLITLFPVLSGLIVASFYALLQGMIKLDKIAPMLLIQGALFVLGTFVYITSRPDQEQQRLAEARG